MHVYGIRLAKRARTGRKGEAREGTQRVKEREREGGSEYAIRR